MKKGHVYPHLWKTGPDPERHHRYDIWLQQRNQAEWRGEEWDLSFEQWLVLWEPDWHRRGRTRGCMCMTRRDWDQPWSADNVEIITREQHARHQRERRLAGEVSAARQHLKEKQ
jgi:hypothetical protein